MTDAGPHPADPARPVDVSISIVTFDSAACIPALLEDLRAQSGVACEVLFVDNASSDATRELLAGARLGDLTLNRANVGFGRAHNQNLGRFRGRYVLLLNPDVRFGPRLCARLAGFLDAHPEVAIAGPRVLEGEARREFRPRRSYPGESMVPLDAGGSDRDLAWLSGSCLIVRRPVLEELGGFDPAFFLYAEEIDLCLRARRAGYRVGWCGEAEVHHLQHHSQPGVDAEERARRLFRGIVRFWDKHHAPVDVRRMLRFQVSVCALLLALGPARRALSRRWPALDAARLRGRLAACREGLAAAASPPRPIADLPLGILLRQAALLAHWARHRAWPLDDY